ncbi:MAG TPA: hypothetical protein VF491_25605 [Vicinamibacterales bacterium]|jgi:hypothetical protein
MDTFIRRFMGALALDASAFEDIEADRSAALQSLTVVTMAAAAGGVAAIGLGLVGLTGFMVGAVMVFGAWLVWIATIAVIGTVALPEPQTRSSMPELIRTLGFATAPGVLIAFAAMPSAAPIVIALVSAWVIADAVVAMRQALDYHSTGRAIAVCVIAWVVSGGVFLAIAAILTRSVS